MTKHVILTLSIVHIKVAVDVKGRGKLSSLVPEKKNHAKQREELQSICFSKGTQPCVQEASLFVLWD